MYIQLKEKQIATLRLMIKSEIRDEQLRIERVLNENADDLNRPILNALKDRKALLEDLIGAFENTYIDLPYKQEKEKVEELNNMLLKLIRVGKHDNNYYVVLNHTNIDENVYNKIEEARRYEQKASNYQSTSI